MQEVGSGIYDLAGLQQYLAVPSWIQLVYRVLCNEIIPQQRVRSSALMLVFGCVVARSAVIVCLWTSCVPHAKHLLTTSFLQPLPLVITPWCL